MKLVCAFYTTDSETCFTPIPLLGKYFHRFYPCLVLEYFMQKNE